MPFTAKTLATAALSNANTVTTRVTPRDARQASVAEWCKRCFGEDHAASVDQRGIRFLEEAVELYQAVNGDRAMAHKMVDYVFCREKGEPFQELGGVEVTTLALAAALGMSADAAGAAEVERVTSKPAAHFTERNRAKNEAGFDVTGGYPVG
jgi:hypothetical protein